MKEGDKRKNNKGGARAGSGRKSKAAELKVNQYGTDAIIKVYGSMENYYMFIAKEAKTSFQHLKLIQEYTFGKVQDKIEIDDISDNKPTTILKFKQYNKDNEDN
tara:strand:+ start:138 stop:449 length:312 start_codon:yes stop_codon:yes gene_type:complete